MKKEQDRTVVNDAAWGILAAAVTLAGVSLLGLLFRKCGFPETNIVLLYLLAVLFTARLTKGYVYGVVTSVAATLVFNYLFTAPYFTLNVYEPSYIITFVIMTVTALVTSTLTTKIKKNAAEAIKRELETQRLHQEMEQERYRGNLLRAISHDLRTPLSGIMGTSEMIMDMSEKKDVRYELAEGIHKDADWLHRLVENILNLTRLQEGRIILNKQKEAVEEVIGSAAAQIEKRYPDKEVLAEIPDNVLMVPMDGRLVEQVLVNLLDNAAKYTPAGGGIEISVKEDEEKQEAVFTVSDRGEGIRPEEMGRLFELFYTSGPGPSDSQKGIGIGLTICESIVKAHGGSITACNRNDGTGAQFKFTLPMKEGGEADE